jgi:hypothetical protein
LPPVLKRTLGPPQSGGELGLPCDMPMPRNASPNSFCATSEARAKLRAFISRTDCRSFSHASSSAHRRSACLVDAILDLPSDHAQNMWRSTIILSVAQNRYCRVERAGNRVPPVLGIPEGGCAAHWLQSARSGSPEHRRACCYQAPTIGLPCGCRCP